MHARADTSVLDFIHSVHTYPVLLAILARTAVAGRSRGVLGQRVDKKLNVIYYASRTLDDAQRNYYSKTRSYPVNKSFNKN